MKLLLAMLACVAAGCVEEALDRGPTITSHVVTEDYPAYPRTTLDVLFVIDSGPAMASRRSGLRAAYHQATKMIEQLHQRVHIGVVTSDLGGFGCGPGDAAVFRTIPRVHGEFIDTGPALDGSQANFTGSLGDTLAELADVGSEGCPTAQPLAAMARALADLPIGFLYGPLEVIFVTMADDASPDLGDRDEGYVNVLATATGLPYVDVLGGPSMLDVEGMSDPLEFASSGCRAHSSARLRAFANRFKEQGTFTSICDGDLSSTTLSQGRWPALAGLLCLEASLADIDAATPGLQFECNVLDVLPDRSDGTVLPHCDSSSSNLPCYRLIPNLPGCGDRLEFVRDRLVDTPWGTHNRLQCLAE